MDFSPERNVTIFDIDGVLVNRIPLQSGAFKLKIPDEKLLTPGLIPSLDRYGYSLECFPTDQFSRLTQGWRRLKPEAITTVKRLKKQGCDIYLNTGRPDTREWDILTYKQLQEIESCINGAYFRPRRHGVTATQSKIEAIKNLTKKYDQMRYVDDNPFDALPVADYFKDIKGLKVYILKDWSYRWIVRGRLPRYPNVQAIRSLSELFF